MEAWDDGQRVRPIPSEEDDDGAIEMMSPGDGEPPRPNRPWLPIILAIAAVGIIVGSVTVFGALRFDDPPPLPENAFSEELAPDEEGGTTTTATSLPPRLDAAIPGLNDRLTLIAEGDGTVYTLLWDPTFRVPKAVPLPIELPVTDRPAVASFDRGGRFVAIEVCLRIDCSLYVGPPTDIGEEPDVVGNIEWVWHANEVGRIAWAELEPAGTTSVYTASVNALSSGLDDVELMFTVDGLVELRQWDQHGFILRNNSTTAYTESGDIIWVAEDSISASATDNVVALVETDFEWSFVDRRTGEPVEVPISGSAEDSFVWLTTSESAELIARVAEGLDASRLTVFSADLNAPRLVSVKKEFMPLRFTESGLYFVYASDGMEVLAFVDWRTGASYEVEMPSEYRIVGFYLG